MPTRICSRATPSLPRKPITPAAATQPRSVIGCGIDQLRERLPEDQGGAHRDRDDDQQAGDIFKPCKAIGIAAGGRAAYKVERDQQRDGVERVTEVVNGVGEQRHAAAPVDDRDLQHRGHAEQRQRDPDGSNALVGRREGRVRNQGLSLAAMAVEVKDRREQAPDTAAMSYVHDPANGRARARLLCSCSSGCDRASLSIVMGMCRCLLT